MPKKKSTKGEASEKRPSKHYVKVVNRIMAKLCAELSSTGRAANPHRLARMCVLTLERRLLKYYESRFDRFRWIITESENSIKMERGITKVRTSQQLLAKMGSEQVERNRDIKTDIIRRFFSIHYSELFKEDAAPVYVSGSLSKILHTDILRLSNKDKEAINSFLPEYISSGSLSAQ
jgi:hypothetical protein